MVESRKIIMPNLSVDSLIFILVGLTTISSLLYLREYFYRKKQSSYQREFLESTRLKSLELLKAAEDIETQIIGEGKIGSQKLEAEFRAYLDHLIQTSTKNVTDSQAELVKFLEDLKKQGEAFEQTSRTVSEQRINALFERLETSLSDFLIQTEQKTTSSIELELKATRQLIDTYKAQQLKLIDENIIAMMEQTLNTVLGKKLSLKDQVELVYEALEKAKIEKFVI